MFKAKIKIAFEYMGNTSCFMLSYVDFYTLSSNTVNYLQKLAKVL